MPFELTLRAVTPADEPFLQHLYASTRAEELALTDWSAAQKQAFVQAQFQAQTHHYRTYYPTATFSVIVHAGTPVGRLYVDRWPREIRIMDIALLPPYRNHGWGTQLLQHLLAEGQAQGKAVSIHVEKFNPAYRLYTRLGFAKVGETGVYDLLRWATP